MKRFIFLLTTIFICTIAYAHTINWHVGDTILETTTCDSGESITPPTAPYKYGYYFVEWVDYRPIEYLESTGTQYIDTGFVPTNKTSMQTKYHFLSLAPSGFSYQVGAGTDNDRYRFRFLISDNKSSVSPVIGTNLQQIAVNNTIHNITLDAKTYSATVDGVTVMQQNKSFIGSNRSFYIFNLNNDTNNMYLHDARCYYLKLYDNDILVRDFIPVLDKNGVPCMYDRVEKKFYYNAGTGQFIAGPVIGE